MLTCPPLCRAPSPRINTNHRAGCRRFSAQPCSFHISFLTSGVGELTEIKTRSCREKLCCAILPGLRFFAAERVQHPGPHHVRSAWVVFLIKMEVYELTSCTKDIVGLWFITVLNNKKEKGNVCYKSQRTQDCFSTYPTPAFNFLLGTARRLLFFAQQLKAAFSLHFLEGPLQASIPLCLINSLYIASW